MLLRSASFGAGLRAASEPAENTPQLPLVCEGEGEGALIAVPDVSALEPDDALDVREAWRRDLLLRAKARRALDTRQAEFDLFKFIALHQARFRKPEHMARLVEAFDRAMRGPVFCIIEAPSRHLKTSIFQAAAARLLRYRQRPRVAYCTYANDIAYRRSREVRDLAATAGVWVGEEQRTAQHFDPSKSVAFWQTNTGGQFVAGGRHGQWIGEGFDLILYDDPLKDHDEAESQAYRDEAFDTFRGTLMSRREPGCSVFVGMQRWNEDDPIGRIKAWLEKDPDAPRFEVITLRILDDIEVATDEDGNERIVGGKPLCPWRYDLPAIVEWASLLGPYFWPNLMQDVSPRGKKLFPELPRYTRARSEGSILLISCDPGIHGRDTKKVKRRKDGKPDPSGIVVAWAWLTSREVVDPETRRKSTVHDVNLDVVWAQQLWLEPLDLLEFLDELQRVHYPGAPVLLEEVGAFALLELVAARTHEQLYIVPVVPRGSKLVRSLPTAAGARAGRVRVPARDDATEWVRPFTRELREFTGAPGGTDNMTDALTQLFDQAAMLLGVVQAGAASGGSYTMAGRSP